MDYNYLIWVFMDNISVFIITLLFIIIAIAVIKLITTNEVTQDWTKTKWSRDISAKQLYNEGEAPAENLTGWIPILRSQEVAINQIKGAHFCGVDLMVFRSSAGKVNVLDAYCPHMGTYLPNGGKVVGDNVRCPFHNWTFNGMGECTHVPGLNSTNLPKAKIKTWISGEANGLIMFWYDSNDESPNWYPMDNKTVGLELKSTKTMLINGHFTDFSYNAADNMHFHYIHSYPGTFDLDSLYQQDFFFRIMSKVIRIKFVPKFRILPEKHRAEHRNEISVYLFGKLILSDITLTVELDGPYINYSRLTGALLDRFNLAFFISGTILPIPGRKFQFRMIHYCKPTFLNRTISFILTRFQRKEIEKDIPIWSAKKVLKNPYLCKLDQDYALVMRWLAQFHPKDNGFAIFEE